MSKKVPAAGIERPDYRSLSSVLREARQFALLDYSQLVRMARAAMGISQGELARRCKLSEATIRRLEQSQRIRGATESLERVLEFFELNEYEFLLPGADGMLGVRCPYSVRA